MKKPRRIAASQSFTLEEVSWLHQLMMKMLTGGDVTVLRRAPVARQLFSKLQAMKNRVEKVKRERAQS